MYLFKYKIKYFPDISFVIFLDRILQRLKDIVKRFRLIIK